MKTKNLLLVIAVLAALAVCAQTGGNVPYTMGFWLDGKSYVARLKRDAVLAGPVWDTGKPLPLSFARAEQVARAELRKMVSDEPAWHVRRFELTHPDGLYDIRRRQRQGRDDRAGHVEVMKDKSER